MNIELNIYPAKMIGYLRNDVGVNTAKGEKYHSCAHACSLHLINKINFYKKQNKRRQLGQKILTW